MKKILFLSTRLPSPSGTADSFTVFKMIEYFSIKNYQVDLITLCKKNDKRDQGLQKFCNKISYIEHSLLMSVFFTLFRFFNLKPMQVNFFYSPYMHKIVKKFTDSNEYDYVYFHLLRAGQYRKSISTQAKLIIGMQTSFTLNYKRLIKYAKNIFVKIFYSIELKLIQKLEPNIINDFDLATLISEKDVDSIGFKSEADLEKILILPHGIDVKYFSRDSVFELKKNPFVITFPANFKSEANQDAASWLIEEIIPKLKLNLKNFKILMLGANPSKKIKAFSKFEPFYSFTGYVDDLRDYLEKSSLIINPVRVSSGMQNKVILGMSYGLPVLTTSTSIEGMKMPRDLVFECPIDSDAFVKNIIGIYNMNSTELNYRLSRAKKYVNEFWTWEHYLDKLELRLKRLSERN